MNHYVQLKDGIVFATLNTPGEIEESTSIIKVNIDPETLLNKKYDNGNFIDVPVIKYALIDSNSRVVAIERTIFPSDVRGPIIDNDNVEILWIWDGTTFSAPIIEQPVVEEALPEN